jgi:hypothetical protein
MAEKRNLKLAIFGGDDIADATLSRNDGGHKLQRGVRELVTASHPDIGLGVRHERCGVLAELGQSLESGSSSLISDPPDVVLLSLAAEAVGLGSRASTAEQAVQAVRADLVSVINLIKEKVGAHVLVANVSTIDPADQPFNYHGRAEEPFTLRAHRLDLMLVGVSHDEGISIVDVDRLIAELGAAGNVDGPAAYGPEACARIAAEIVRIIDDYGFLDERPLLAQVGARPPEPRGDGT